MALGKNITWKRRKEKQYHLPYNIKAVGKNMTMGRGEGDRHFWEENQDFKTWGWVIIASCRDLYTPLFLKRSIVYRNLEEVGSYEDILYVLDRDVGLA